MYEFIIGKITHFYAKIGVVVIKLSFDIKIDDLLHYKGDNYDFEEKITSLQLNHKEVTNAKIGDSVGIKINSIVKVDNLVFKIEE
jgi:hypothetical protein